MPRYDVVLIGGSVRPGNYTAHALDLVEDELRRKDVGVDRVDVMSLDLAPPGRESADSAAVAELIERVKAATGVVLATPEYHGSYSSFMKLVIDNLGFPSALGGKPVALLGVAAGAVGAMKALEHLRSVCSHVGSLVLPGPVSVAGVQKVFDADGVCHDPAVEKLVRGLAGTLVDYIEGHICPRIALEAMVRGDSVS